MRAILMFQWEVMDKVTRQCPLTNHNLFEERGEPKRYRTEVLPLHQPNALPLGQTGSQSWAFRPNEPCGFRGRKAILNSASALVTICP